MCYILNESNKLLCEKCDFYPAVGEFDLGQGVKFYCRSCVEWIQFELADTEIDESLVFCEKEWNEQK